LIYMATLVMTIDSSSDEGEPNNSIKPNIKTKKDKKSNVTIPDEDGDILIAERDVSNSNTHLFVPEDSDGSSQSDYLKRDDGTRGNTWSFRDQLVTRREAEKKAAEDNGDDLTGLYEPQAPVTIIQRIEEALQT